MRLTKTFAAFGLAALVLSLSAQAQKGRGAKDTAAPDSGAKQVTVTLVRWPYT